MMKRKIMGIALSTLLFLGTGSAIGTQIASAEEPEAEESVTQLSEENASLFLPGSYEQYLPLKSPSHAAFSDDHIAVADGSTLYLYDRATAQYSYYEHRTGANETATTISELQFSPDGVLYFNDQSSEFYRYDMQDNKAVLQNISCTTFLLADERIYYATTTVTNTVTFYYIPVAGGLRTPFATYSALNPHLAYENGILHCIIDDNIRYAFDTSKVLPDGSFERVEANKPLGEDKINGLRYVCAYDGALYFTVSGARDGNGLYRTDGNGAVTLLLAEGNLSTLTVYNNRLYCVQGNSVKEISVLNDGAVYTGYEISAASASENRLSGASSLVRAGNLLVSADAGNNRISVYNFKTGKFTAYPVSNASVVATDGSTIAATDGEKISVISYPDGSIQTYDINIGRVTGLAVFFSSVYYVTSNNMYGLAGSNVTVNYPDIDSAPAGMACDLYGKIYVAYNNGDVYEFQEEYFSRRGTPVKSAVTLPAPFTAFRCDFEGNLYCLSGNTLYKNRQAFANVTGSDFVYHTADTTARPLSCAVGFEDDAVYFCFGDYIVASAEGALDIPTLGKISLGTAKEQIFSTGDIDSLLVDVKENSVGIKISLADMGAAEHYFPYTGYARTQEARGVKLAQTELYTLVLLEKDKEYEALLLRTESTQEADGEITTQLNEHVYLSNAVNACYFPCLEQSLTQNRFMRGASVTKLGEIVLPERAYALVSYESDNQTYTAYVPLSYLSGVNPAGIEGENYTLGYLKAGETKFLSNQGEELTVTERTPVRLYLQGDGTYIVRFEKDGVLYSANVEAGRIDNGASDALRTSLIIILSVLAVLIIGIYIYFLPIRKKRR